VIVDPIKIEMLAVDNKIGNT